MAARGDDSKFAIATTVTLVLAVAALVLVKEPLKSSRPGGGGIELRPTEELQVRAKPWQDPFEAVQRDLNAKRKDGRVFTGAGTVRLSSEGSAQRQTAKADVTVATGGKAAQLSGGAGLQQDVLKRAKQGATITALVVMTAGGPYVDGAESRLEDRYAVQSALNVGCFAPEATEVLHYFTWQFNYRDGSREVSREVVTPFEWYNRNKTADCAASHTYDHDVLILWVKAEDYHGRVLGGLEMLLGNLTEQPLSIKVLGPRSSSELQSMLQEVERRRDDAPPLRGGRAPSTGLFTWPTRDGDLELYSPWATAMPGLLAYQMKGGQKPTPVPCESYSECEGVFRQLLAAAGLHVLYSIDSDRDLFETLFRELDRRNVTVGEDRLVLIGEWDSFYARSLPITFSAAACHYIAEARTRKSRSPSESVVNRLRGKCDTTEEGVNALINGNVLPGDLNVTRYSYLSGLDGESLEDQQRRPKGKSGDEEKAKDSKANLRDVGQLEKPEGTSQFDYVRRLVSRIKSEEQEGAQPARKVQAIGILGRDSYDSLLILQAVREQFPGVLFFTQDLYARYFHANERPSTRNLLVVSHFGLQLHPRLQQSIPPFRSTYQTSTFFALLRSIGRIDQRPCLHERALCYVWTGSPQEYEYAGRIEPRIFEIGRQGAVDLSVSDLPPAVTSVHPQRTDVDPKSRAVRLPEGIGRLVIVLLLVTGVFLVSYGRLWRWLSAAEINEPRMRARAIAARFALVLLPVLLLGVLWSGLQVYEYDADEPFSWSDGVSVWPTEAVRIVAGLLCLWFLLKGRADLRQNTTELSRRFFPQTAGNETGSPRFWRQLAWMLHGSRPGTTPTAAELWVRYCGAHRVDQRIGRVALLLLLYFVIIWSIWPLLNDGQWRLFVPCRGAVSCSADRVATLFSVVPLVLLNLSVLDGVLLCARWVNEVSRAEGLSPVSTIRLIGERTRVVNRRVLYAFVALALVMAARNHYFDAWDFPPALIVVLTAHSLVALMGASILYLASAAARTRVLASIQEQVDRSMHWDVEKGSVSDLRASAERLRTMRDEIASVHQGAFQPLYQQPAVQASLVVALTFLQYWYLGQ